MNLTLIFVAGVSFLAGIILVSLAMFVGALLGRQPTNSKTSAPAPTVGTTRLVPAVIL